MSLLGIIASQNYPRTFTVDFLVIAGGAGGGDGVNSPDIRAGGGGGAGGYRNSSGTSGANSSAETPISASPGINYTVTVGAGGAFGGSGAKGSNGEVVEGRVACAYN